MGASRRIDRWLPAAIEELAIAATSSAKLDAACATAISPDDDVDIDPSDDEVVRFLCQPAPWPLAAILHDLCERCEVEPPKHVIEAMRACQPLHWDARSNN